MRIFQTFILPDKIVSKHKLSFAAANFSRNLIGGGGFDKVYSLIPVNVIGDLGSVDESGYDIIYSRWRKNRLLRKLAIFAEQWSVFKKVGRNDSMWFYNLNFLNAYLFILLKLFKPSVKLNVIVLDFTPPTSWRDQNYWFLKLINSSDGAIYLSPSKLYKVKKSAVIPGVVPLSGQEKPQLRFPEKEFLLSGVISSTISMTRDVLDAFSKHPECMLHIAGRVLEDEAVIKEYGDRFPNIIYHGIMPFDRYVELMHRITFQLSARDPRMPENQNNFPSKIIEALLHNRIVVSTMCYTQLKGINYISLNFENIEKGLSAISNMSDEQLLEYANQGEKVRKLFGVDVWLDTIDRVDKD